MKRVLFFVGLASIMMSFAWMQGELNFEKPVKKAEIKEGFGKRIHPIHKIEKMHKGIDYKVEEGTPIYAAESGIIKKAERKTTGYGYNIILKHNKTFSSRYAHLSSFAVAKGEKVKKGQLIGYVGNTGASYSSHLHFEIIQNGKAVNPEPFL